MKRSASRIFGWVLVLIGLGWIVLSFLGAAMMARTVHFSEDVLLPAIPGAIAMAIGAWLLIRR